MILQSTEKVFSMSYLKQQCRDILKDKVLNSESYRSEMLKKRQKPFVEQICFQQQFDPSKHELVHNSTAFLEGVIIIASELCSKLQDKEGNLSAPENKGDYSPVLELF